MSKNHILHIAMFGHKHMLSREGGIEIVVNELCTRMVAQGHCVVCFDRNSKHVSKDEALEQKKEYKGVKIVPVWTVDKKGIAAMTSSLSAVFYVIKNDYDIVHIHAEGPAAVCGLLHFLWKRKKKNKKIVVTIHGLDWARAKWSWFAKKYIKFGEKQAVKYADEIIVLSRGIQEYFQNEYGRKTVFIPNGISKPIIQNPNEIKQLWCLEKNSYVLFLGRIVPEKGLQYLIEAWKEIKTDKKLVIAGGSSDTDDFVSELKQQSPRDVVFTGFQEGRVLEELYSNAYIYCLPSDLEGMPLSLLEAMSYGNCCLVSDIAECTEVVENNAVVFKKSDVLDLKMKLQELLDDDERVAEYKRNASEYICTKYNWNSVIDKTLNLYRD